MGKTKKFIDKKKAATFQLLSRDSSDPNYDTGPSGDRVFYRVDNSNYSTDAFDADDSNGDVLDNEANSIYADAPEDYEVENNGWNGFSGNGAKTAPLPDRVRKEILELGFPDDGYNYLTHLREIKNTGGGSAYYENPKAVLHELPRDVKAYDASRVEISKLNDDTYEKSVYNVAAKTVGVRVQKAVDPEVSALLEDDSDLSRFGSDVEDLDEDFVVKANLPDESVDVELGEKLSLVEKSDVDKRVEKLDVDKSFDTAGHIHQGNKDKIATFSEKPRLLRPLDEQFDMLELREYGSDSEDEYDCDMAEEIECPDSLAEKLNHAFKVRGIDSLELNYNGLDDGESPESAAVVVNRCKEYAEKYENESQEGEVISSDESSSDSEVWDCETIVSTYSNLDNHPGKIEAPRRKKLLPVISEASILSGRVISLKGKEKLPVDFLPSKVKHAEKEDKKKQGSEMQEKDKSKSEQLKRKQHGQESKEEKKERKAAVKEERREARRVKKETKGLYRCEAQRAQKVAAFTGPSAIHLM